MEESIRRSGTEPVLEHIFGVHLRKIGVFNVTLYMKNCTCIPDLQVEGSTLTVLFSEKIIRLKFQNLSFRSTNALSSRNVLSSGVISYRILTEDPERFKPVSNNITLTSKIFVPEENGETRYSTVCRSCESELGQVQFTRVRKFPDGNWIERANSLWFCHPNGGSCFSQEPKCKSVVSEELLNLIQYPPPSYCYYGSCFYIMNGGCLPGIDSLGACKKCSQVLSLKMNESTLKVWSNGVKWRNLSDGSCFETTPEDSFINVMISVDKDLEMSPGKRVKLRFNNKIGEHDELLIWILDNKCISYDLDVGYKNSGCAKTDLLEYDVPEKLSMKCLYSLRKLLKDDYQLKAFDDDVMLEEIEVDYRLIDGALRLLESCHPCKDQISTKLGSLRYGFVPLN